MSIPPPGGNLPADGTSTPYAHTDAPPLQGQTWPPSPAGGGAYPNAETNTSGQQSEPPPPINSFKWSWGAFALDWIWCLNHGMVPLGLAILLSGLLLGLIPIVGSFVVIALVCVRVYLGRNGNRLAWMNRRYDGGVAQFLEVETIWKNWGIALLVLSLILPFLIAVILFPVFVRARERAREHAVGTAPSILLPMVNLMPTSYRVGNGAVSSYQLRSGAIVSLASFQ